MTGTDSYLRYLPAVYATGEPEFLLDYLKIFQKILTGIAPEKPGDRRGIQELLAAEVIGNLFYPRLSFLFPTSDTDFIPPISGAKPADETAILTDLNSYIGVPAVTDPLAKYVGQTQPGSGNLDGITAWLNDFLLWLGNWVGLVLDNSWSIDKKRDVMAQIMALYRMRGTLDGISMLCKLLLDLPLTVGYTIENQDGTYTNVTGQISVVFSNPQPKNIVCQGSAQNAFILNCVCKTGAPVLGGYLPWLFEAQIELPNKDNPSFILTKNIVQQVQTLYAQLQQLLAGIKPAVSVFQISIVPSMQLREDGCATNLGINTLLGD